jgi:hypothetical protein
MNACTLPARSDAPIKPDVRGVWHSIHVALYEHEQGDFDFETWPAPVQQIMMRERDNLCMRYPDETIAEQKCSIDPVRRVCVLMLMFGEPKVVEA